MATLYTSRNTTPVLIEDLKVGDRIAYDNGAKLGLVSEIIKPAPKYGTYLYLITVRGKSNRPVYRRYAPGVKVQVCVPVVSQ